VERAARVTSPVEHRDYTLRATGSVLGVLAGAAIVIIGRGRPRAIKAGIGVANYGRQGGIAIDGMVKLKSGSEKIVKGVPSVILEEEKHEAANTSPKTKTDQHAASPKTGSDSVFIEKYPASRRTDRVECKGTIIEGAPHILYGGGLTSAELELMPDLPKPLQVLEAMIVAANNVANPSPRNRFGVLRKVAAAKKKINWAKGLLD
jgi:hypothetical protein